MVRSAYYDVVEVGAAVDGCCGGADGVVASIEVYGGRHGDPVGPVAGGGEGQVGYRRGSVDEDVHGAVRGRAVGVVEDQGCRAVAVGGDGPLGEAADGVGGVDESGAGETGPVVVDGALEGSVFGFVAGCVGVPGDPVEH